MPSCRSAKNLQPLQHIIAYNSLSRTRNNVGLFQSIEPSQLRFRKHEVSKLSVHLETEQSGIGFSNSREDLFLLGLVVQNGDFLPLLILELAADERISD